MFRHIMMNFGIIKTSKRSPQKEKTMFNVGTLRPSDNF